MGPLDLFWLFLNGLAPAIGVAGLATLMSRAIWRRLASRGGGRQWGLATLAGLAGQALGWWWTGRDGTMLGYALLVCAVGVSSWWHLFGDWRSTR